MKFFKKCCCGVLMFNLILITVLTLLVDTFVNINNLLHSCIHNRDSIMKTKVLLTAQSSLTVVITGCILKIRELYNQH